jgi:hypothetical protein
MTAGDPAHLGQAPALVSPVVDGEHRHRSDAAIGRVCHRDNRHYFSG